MSNAQSKPLRVLSFAAGAIGTYVGGSLRLAGHEVVFIERPEVAASLRQRGLHLVVKDQEHHLENPQVVDSLSEALAVSPYDVAIFAMKSFDTEAALQQVAPHREAMPPILSLQNGVDNEATIAGVLGAGKVIAGTVTSAITRRAAGDIVLERLRGTGLAAEHSLANRLAMAFNAAGLKAMLYAHTADMKWSKMLTNLLANASSAILDMTPAEIFSHPGLFKMEIEQLREALQVMDRLRIQVVDLPGTPVRALAFSIRRMPAGLARTLLKNAVGGGRGGKMPSFHIDLHSGRGKSEVDFLNGAIVRYGHQVGIKTPVNQLLSETLRALTDGSLSSATYAHQPEKLLKQL